MVTLQEPTAHDLAEARKSLAVTALPDQPATRTQEGMTAAFDRVAVYVSLAAYRYCKELTPRIPAERCKAVYWMPTIQQGQEINAFADDRDRVSVYTGLLNNLRADREQAAVLAHEYAHVMLGHVDKKGTNTMTGLLLGSVLGGAIQGATGHRQDIETWAKVGAIVGSRAYSPEMELEADRLAVYILEETEFFVLGMHDALVRLHHLNTPTPTGRGSPSRVGFLETHPSDDRRIAHVLSAIQDVSNGVPLFKD